MHQSFTGSARKPRQVNLSGRNANPFGGTPWDPSATGMQRTIANAQQERQHRQQKRDRVNASKTIQRIWRGYHSRRGIRESRRRSWDESLAQSADGYHSTNSREHIMDQTRLLLSFIDLQRQDDVCRLCSFAKRFLQSAQAGLNSSEREVQLLLRLEKSILTALSVGLKMAPPEDTNITFLSLLDILSTSIPKETSQNSRQYYSVLLEFLSLSPEVDRELLTRAILSPLRAINPESLTAYEGFSLEFLTKPTLQAHSTILEELADVLNQKLLAHALLTALSTSTTSANASMNSESRLWLLAYFIYFDHRSHGIPGLNVNTPEPNIVRVVSILLSSVADELSSRIELDDIHMDDASESDDSSTAGHHRPIPLPEFVRSEITSLVNQKSVTGLLAGAYTVTSEGFAKPSLSSEEPEDAGLLASYALTLLRVFPSRADEIRMWLFLGSAARSAPSEGHTSSRIPAIKYFWQAARHTDVYMAIRRDPKEALRLLNEGRQVGPNRTGTQKIDQDWRVILIFIELYIFILKVMDDEEFFSGSPIYSSITVNQPSSRTRESALPLEEVRDLTIFLKNLAFTMYWNATDLLGISNDMNNAGIGSYFNASTIQKDERPILNLTELGIAGLAGLTIDYVKGIATGLLRMIYERDSRRRFCPKDHWLMTSRFDMDGFISAVVVEEEKRHDVQDDNDDDENNDGNDMDDGSTERRDRLVGTRRSLHSIEALRKQQQKASRRKVLQAIRPRLEILQNLPFFIPFETRVQIFKEFIHLDQHRRRGGHVDPDNWRMSLLQNPLPNHGEQAGRDIISRHQAKIRRDNVFEDAFRQFYSLGEGLKEPIQITFVDKFDTVEAGIDGGGVTKEFLTTVTHEAFSTTDGPNLFVENDQNLLYPNPTAVEELEYMLRDAKIQEGSPEWNEPVRDLLRRYEFLGRVIGKCLYEGILVDIGFAPFFLLKWALTGGSGSATRESSYRANINDLRDLDEGLYQGLLQLKNFSGNVEDFSLDFTITDTVFPSGDHTQSRTITRDLKPNGSNIAVTSVNRLEYISYVARHRLQIQPRHQSSAFLRGLGGIIQPSWLSMFNQSEMQTLVGGDSTEINIADLRHNTQYGGVYVIGDDNKEHPSIEMFWEVMNDLSDTDRRKVLKFVTSTPRAPLLGFSQLNPRFSIRDAGRDDERLPSTSTCVNLLKLPMYSNSKTLKEKLLYAVNSGAGFDLS